MLNIFGLRAEMGFSRTHSSLAELLRAFPLTVFSRLLPLIAAFISDGIPLLVVCRYDCAQWWLHEHNHHDMD